METISINRIGSTTVVTDGAGKVVQRFSYRPFGAFAGPGPSDGAAIHHYFTGQERDSSTELYHLGARSYDPALGRFTQPDPITQDVYDPQSLNPYSYARNNPLRLIDPTGLSWQDSWNSFTSGVNQSWQSFTGWASQTWQSTTTFFSQPFQTATTFLGQSLNAATTTAMQSFTQLASLGQSVGQGLTSVGQAWSGANLSGAFFDPTQGFRQTNYRETLSLNGLTQTFSSTAFTLMPHVSPPDPLTLWAQAAGQRVTAAAQPAVEVLLGDPSRLIGWTGLVLRETGHPILGDTLRVPEYLVYTGGFFEKTVGVAGGMMGGAIGRIALTPIGLGSVGAVGGTVVFGYAGGYAGSLLDRLLE